MNFANPWILALIPIAIVALLWLLRKDFLHADARYADEKKSHARLRRRRTWMFLSRATIITLVLIALAGPALEIEEFIDTDPRINVLVDTSNSLEVLDTTRADELVGQLQDRVPVDIQEIGSANQSALGDDILGQLREEKSLLLITDGQVTTGASLANIASFANSIQATLNALHLPVQQADTSVSITGPNQVIEDNTNTWEVHVRATTPQAVNLEVRVNDEVVLDEQATPGTRTIQRSFRQGEHTIQARITEPSGNEINNAFTRTITATSKPRILYASQKSSGLEEITTELYDADVRRNLPEDLSEYYAIILNDLPYNALRNHQQALANYAAAGNGVLVVGGENSYDQGNYRNTPLETLLPVRVGTGTRNQGGADIVIAMDMSGRTLGSVQQVDGEWVDTSRQTQDIQKSLAIDVIEQLNPTNNVGVLAFTYPQTGMRTCTGACVVQRVEPLYNNREELTDKIARLEITGGTSHGTGMEASLQLLQESTGSKNIIFISDGISGNQDHQRALNAARTLAAQGGKVYAVLVGNSDQGASFMQQLAAAGNGVYFRADQTNRLSLLFGEPIDLDQGDAFDLVTLNEHHFITKQLETRATLFGYNQVTPKSSSQTLLTSNAGDPVLTVWNYGVGRVAAITGFNGADLGQLLQEPNSQAISRTINWLISDPQRLETASIRVPDGRVGEEMRINLTAPNTPQAEGLSFERIEENQYYTTITPQETGVFSILGATYAVNYPREYERLGMSEELQEAVELTGGAYFTDQNAQQVIEHAKELSQLRRSEQEQVRWPFILAALAILFIELFIRRVQEIKRR